MSLFSQKRQAVLGRKRWLKPSRFERDIVALGPRVGSFALWFAPSVFLRLSCVSLCSRHSPFSDFVRFVTSCQSGQCPVWAYLSEFLERLAAARVGTLISKEWTIWLRKSMEQTSRQVLDAQRSFWTCACQECYRTTMQGLQENFCSQERSTGSKEKNTSMCVNQKRAMRREPESKLKKRSEEEVEVEQIRQSNGRSEGK